MLISETKNLKMKVESIQKHISSRLLWAGWPIAIMLVGLLIFVSWFQNTLWHHWHYIYTFTTYSPYTSLSCHDFKIQFDYISPYTSFSCDDFKIHFDAIFTIYTLKHHIHQNIASSLSQIVFTTNIEYTACTKMGIYNM